MLDQLIEQSKAFDEHKSDYGPAPVKSFMFHNHTAELSVPGSLFQNSRVMLTPTEHAFGQICQKLGPAAFPGTAKTLPANYLLACPPIQRADHLNHWLFKTNGGRQWFVRGYDHDARAVLSDKYGTVGVTETLEWVRDAIDAKGGTGGVRVINPVVTPDILHLRTLFRDVTTKEGHYGIGGYFTTGEIGNRKLGAFPLIKRTSCDNSIAIPTDAWSWESRHVGDTRILKRLFVTAIYSVLKSSVEALDKLMQAMDVEIPDFTKYVDGLVKGKGWEIETKDRILIGSEGHTSLFGLVQGVSSAAKFLDDDERATMELFAGRLLVQDRWANGRR